MLTISSLLWRPNDRSYDFSKCYTPEWADKLYRGFARNLTIPFKFLLWADQHYELKEDITLVHMNRPHNYGSCIKPFQLSGPQIIVGLDTLILGNIDRLAAYVLNPDNKIALPRDPNRIQTVCNGVALVPPEHDWLYHRWVDEGKENDMAFLRKQDTAVIDDLFPGMVVSYKKHYATKEYTDPKIVYFHGNPKMHEIQDAELLVHWI